MKLPGRAGELLQHVGEAFVFADTDFRVREIHVRGERIGDAPAPASALIGTSLWDFWPDLEDSDLGRLWTAAMRERRPVSLEHLHRWPDGRQAWLEMRAYPAGDGLAIFYRDIGDRKTSEEELKRAQAELIHASRISAMGAMASTLAHELSQPLTAIGNYVEATQTILRAVPAAEVRQARQALRLAGAATERASEILRRLRAFVSKGQIEADVHDVQMIIADACVLLVPHAQREGVEIRFELDRYGKWVKADAVQIQQVLINLVRNAIEAMRASERKLITIATALLPDGTVEVTVEDSGPGLGEEAAGTLFSPFQSGKADGMGVGLSISRSIVEAHGGTIGAGQASGGGAVFRFTLPRGQEPDSAGS